ncbi:MAG: aldehyde dehydrogenase family protein [Gammaproteobacteria bacterium]|nr:aldehyde dehydrogenase family protein [Gammaproteobacteria bacterium]
MPATKGITFATRLFIGGEFVDGAAGTSIEVVNPHDGSRLTEVAEAREIDVDRAVAAARAAFAGWRDTPAAERGRLLFALADRIEQHFDAFAELEALDTGHPIRDARFLDVPRTIANFRYYGGLADKVSGRQVPAEPGFLNYVKREPVGVVGQITPWNFPLMFTSWKLGPALAAGNCVVLKPSELVPLSTLRLAELIAEVGFPPGVVNIVPGYGHVAGQHLAEHPQADKIAFTGSTATGRRIVAASAGNLKRVQLELGGKGANIVFDDANLPAAINGSAFAIFHNQGQACIAGSRLLLHERIAQEFLERFMALAASIRVGDPLDPRTEMGPLTSKLHQERVLAYCDIARQEGGEVLLGGCVPAEPAALARGYYLQPTIVRAKPGDRVFQEEVFGPFVSITTFRDEEEAVRLANATDYGLGGGLWTTDLGRAHRVAERIRAGMVWVNCYKRVNPGAPFGGVGGSGYGRDLGVESMYEYTDAKSIVVNYDARIPPYYRR